MNIFGGFALRSIGALALGSAVALAPQPALAARHHRAKVTSEASEESAEAGSSETLKGPYQEACLIEPTSGTVVFAKNEHQPWPTASLAKMMLMEIVAEKLDDGSLKLSDQIPTSEKAAKMGGSQVYLKPGESFSLDDMMKAIVVHSANDASVAVAEYIGGSTLGNSTRFGPRLNHICKSSKVISATNIGFRRIKKPRFVGDGIGTLTGMAMMLRRANSSSWLSGDDPYMPPR